MWTKTTIAALTSAEFDKLEMNERRLIAWFQTDDLSFTCLPHMITRLRWDYLKALGDHAYAKLGLWNYPIPYGPEGNELSLEQRRQNPIPFIAWASERNQEAVLDICKKSAMCLYDVDVIICDCSCSEVSIAECVGPALEEMNQFSERIWSVLADLVKRIGWAVIPLASDGGYCLLVCKAELSEFLSDIERWCGIHKHAYARLEQSHGKIEIIDYQVEC